MKEPFQPSAETEENTQYVPYNLCSWQRCLWQWIPVKIFSCPDRRNSVHKLLSAHSSAQSITPCDWDGLQQQAEQCNRSRFIEQNNRSWGSDIYATYISKVLDWINLGLFRESALGVLPDFCLLIKFNWKGSRCSLRPFYCTNRGMIHRESGKYTWKAPKHLHSVLAWFELFLDWRSKASRSK